MQENEKKKQTNKQTNKQKTRNILRIRQISKSFYRDNDITDAI